MSDETQARREARLEAPRRHVKNALEALERSDGFDYVYELSVAAEAAQKSFTASEWDYERQKWLYARALITRLLLGNYGKYVTEALLYHTNAVVVQGELLNMMLGSLEGEQGIRRALALIRAKWLWGEKL